MPRRPRRAIGQFVFHVFNRAVQGLVLFQGPTDYEAFLCLLKEAVERVPVRILAYVIMPNHWHLVLWPLTDEGLSRFMHRLSATHVQRWRIQRGSTGRGAVYQGRFKAVPVQTDTHFVRVCRYVERNPLRGRLAERAEDWAWSSASPLAPDTDRPPLAPWPVTKPENWHEILNQPEPRADLSEIRDAMRRGAPFGEDEWRLLTAEMLGWRTGMRRRGRPTSVARQAQAGQRLHL